MISRFLAGLALAPSVLAAQVPPAERAELLQAVEEWCNKPSVEGTIEDALVLEGGAAGRVGLRGYGLTVDGQISSRDVQNLNIQLNGIKRSAEDCRAASLKVLFQVFFGNGGIRPVAQVVDTCQESGNLRTCIKRSEAKFFGANVRLPITHQPIDDTVVSYIYAGDGYAKVFTDTGGEYVMTKDAYSQVRIDAGQINTDLISAKIDDFSDVAELAVEICFRQPSNTCFLFDEIYPR